MADTSLHGVLPVFQTPYHDDESIDFETLEREIQWVYDRGADGIVMAMVSEVLRLSDVKRIAEMTEEERGLWPPRPEKVTALGEWLERARELASRLPEHRRSLELLRRDALPHHGTDARRELETHPRFLDRTQKKSRLEVVSKTIAKLEAQLADTAAIPSAAENAKVANSHAPRARQVWGEATLPERVLQDSPTGAPQRSHARSRQSTTLNVSIGSFMLVPTLPPL